MRNQKSEHRIPDTEDRSPRSVRITGVLNSEKGIALMMVLILSAIMLSIMAALIYLMTSGTQLSGGQKRYKTALEGGKGGADVYFQFIASRDDPADIPLTHTFPLKTLTANCMNQKFNRPTKDWDASCNNSLTIDPTVPATYDLSVDLGSYRSYTKIVDTVQGNTGGSEGLRGRQVVGANEGGGITVPYYYTIEVDAENMSQPADKRERAKLSILYEY